MHVGRPSENLVPASGRLRSIDGACDFLLISVASASAKAIGRNRPPDHPATSRGAIQLQRLVGACRWVRLGSRDSAAAGARRAAGGEVLSVFLVPGCVWYRSGTTLAAVMARTAHGAAFGVVVEAAPVRVAVSRRRPAAMTVTPLLLPWSRANPRGGVSRIALSAKELM